MWRNRECVRNLLEQEEVIVKQTGNGRSSSDQHPFIVFTYTV